jgi:hypothetical protein
MDEQQDDEKQQDDTRRIEHGLAVGIGGALEDHTPVQAARWTAGKRFLYTGRAIGSASSA